MKRLDKTLLNAAVESSSVAESEEPHTVEDIEDDNCPLCGGARFVRRDRSLNDPRFGRADPCECVLQESAEARRERLERISNLGALSRFTLDSFEEVSADEAPLVRVRAYALEPEGWLVLRGPSGSGKTHLAAAIANERIARGEPALFVFTPDLLDELRASYQPAEGELGFSALFDQVRNAPLLILDDIDAAASSEWAREKLFQLINARYSTSLPTVFTCHLLTDALDGRIAQRLESGGVVDLSVEHPQEGYRQTGGMTHDRLEDFGFHNFHTRFPNYSPQENESLQSARNTVHRFAEAPDGWLLLQGESGCGKTHLAAAAAARVGCDVFFASVPDLVDDLRSATDSDSGGEGYDALLEEVRSAGLLVLDDLGAHGSLRSSWAKEKLFQIANYRALARLPTLITTDLSVDSLRDFFPRIATRALDPKLSQHVMILAGPYHLPRRRPRSNSGSRRR